MAAGIGLDGPSGADSGRRRRARPAGPDLVGVRWVGGNLQRNRVGAAQPEERQPRGPPTAFSSSLQFGDSAPSQNTSTSPVPLIAASRDSPATGSATVPRQRQARNVHHGSRGVVRRGEVLGNEIGPVSRETMRRFLDLGVDREVAMQVILAVVVSRFAGQVSWADREFPGAGRAPRSCSRLAAPLVRQWSPAVPGGAALGEDSGAWALPAVLLVLLPASCLLHGCVQTTQSAMLSVILCIEGAPLERGMRHEYTGCDDRGDGRS